MNRTVAIAVCCAMIRIATDVHADGIGGFVFAKGTAIDAGGSLLNPGDFLAPSYNAGALAAMASGDWSGISFRLRGQIGIDNPETDTALRVEELYYTHALPADWTLAVGQQVRSWDSGLSYQPLGFFRSQSDLTDPFDQESRVSGLPMIVLSHLGESVNLEAIVSDRLSSADAAQTINARQWAVRASHAFASGLNASLVIRQRDGAAPGAGASASFAWDNLELHADLFYGPRPAAYVHSGVAGAKPLMLYLTDPFTLRSDGPFVLDSVLGSTWTPIDKLSVYTEWDHKGAGLLGQEWRRFQTLIGIDRSYLNGATAALALENLGWDLGVLRSNGARRDYVYAMASYGNQPEAVSLSSYLDLADGSAVSTFSVGLPLPLPAPLLVTTEISALTGASHSDFGLSPYRAIASLRLTYNYN